MYRAATFAQKSAYCAGDAGRPVIGGRFGATAHAGVALMMPMTAMFLAAAAFTVRSTFDQSNWFCTCSTPAHGIISRTDLTLVASIWSKVFFTSASVMKYMSGS